MSSSHVQPAERDALPTSIDLRRRKALSASMNALISFRMSGIHFLQKEEEEEPPLHQTKDEASNPSDSNPTPSFWVSCCKNRLLRKIVHACDPRYWMQRTCLNPEYTLRAQLLWAFGSLIFLTLSFLIVLCISVALFVGQDFKEINQNTFSDALGQGLQGRTARYLAEALELRIIPTDYVNLLYEVTRDRFTGYPIATGDEFVPFKTLDWNSNSTTTTKRKYPIIGPHIPLDWQLTQDSAIETAEDQVRRRRYSTTTPISFAKPGFVMQGACDPSQTSARSHSYLPNCTLDHNQLENGPILQPSNMTQQIHRKARDVAPILKALYEYNTDIHEISVYFANQGSGAALIFPHTILDGTHNFTSVGCDWMTDTPNPVDPSKGPILPAELTKDCPTEGTTVSTRLYNPMLRGWCKRQAQQAGRVVVEGPFLDAFSPDNWLLSLGKAVYDPVTDEFVACTFVGIQIQFLQEILRDSRLTARSELSIVRLDQRGTVVASSAYDIQSVSGSDSIPDISQLRVGIDDFQELYDLVDYSMEWNPDDVKRAYLEYSGLRLHGFFVSAYPIPTVPDVYDPDYRPEFLAIVSIAEGDIFGLVDAVNESVDDHVEQSVLISIVVGISGFLFSILVLMLMARNLTQPLQQMNAAALDICNSFGVTDVEGNKSIHGVEISKSNWPRTEVTALVTQFNEMVSSFSGSLLTRSEKAKEVELLNTFSGKTPEENGVRTEFTEPLYEVHEIAFCPFESNKTDAHPEFERECFEDKSDDEQQSSNEDSPVHQPEADDEEVTIVFSTDDDENAADISYDSGLDKSEPNLLSPADVNDVISSETPSDHHPTKAARSSIFNSEMIPLDETKEEEFSISSNKLFANMVHAGPNLHDTTRSVLADIAPGHASNIQKQRSLSQGLKSPLFLWIVILIVLPLILTTVVISTIVLISISNQFDESIYDSEGHYYDVEVLAMNVTTRLRADFVARNTGRATRDLYILTRYAGWLFFGGLDVPTAEIPLAVTTVNDCKNSDSFDECDWIQDLAEACKNVSDQKEIRDLQAPYYLVSSDASDPETGSRFSTAFPDVHTNPSNTLWWGDPQSLPGAERAKSNIRFATTFERLRTSSANPLLSALRNYDPEFDVTSYFGFEDDGLFIGAGTCEALSHGWGAFGAFWKSTVENGGPSFGPSLCPEERFGYDPRCREWYSAGKLETLDEEKAVYLTSPYLFANDVSIGQTATSPISNSGEYVGQAAVDFFATEIFAIMNTTNTFVRSGGFPLMITSVTDKFGGDVVIGPNFNPLTSSAVPVSEVVLPFDAIATNCTSRLITCKERASAFDEIVSSMKSGRVGVTEFIRSTESGGSEVMVIAYAPAKSRFLDALDSSVFSRGASSKLRNIYSIAIVQPKTSILEPFEGTEEQMNDKMSIAIAVVSCFLFLAVIIAIFVSYKVAQTIALPMQYLLGVVEGIQHLQDDEIPSINKTAGPREIVYVSNTIHSLYRAVSLANAFFQAGELEAAYHRKFVAHKFSRNQLANVFSL